MGYLAQYNSNKNSVTKIYMKHFKSWYKDSFPINFFLYQLTFYSFPSLADIQIPPPIGGDKTKKKFSDN